MTSPDAFRAKQNRSLPIEDLKEVLTVMKAAESLPPVADGALTVMRASDGLEIAEVWWNGEQECWLVDFNFRHKGA